MLPEFCLEIIGRFFDPWLQIFAGKTGFLSFSLLLVRILWNPLPLLLLLLLRSMACDHARSALLPVACSRWIAGATIQWWEFARISENCSNLCCFCANFVSVWFCGSNSMMNSKFLCEIVLNWCWIEARVHENSWVFVNFVILICNCQERENGFCLLLMWREFSDVFSDSVTRGFI